MPTRQWRVPVIVEDDMRKAIDELKKIEPYKRMSDSAIGQFLMVKGIEAWKKEQNDNQAR